MNTKSPIETSSIAYRRIAWLVMLLLLAMNLSMLPAPRPALAQDGCDEGFVLNDESGDCEEATEEVPALTDEDSVVEGEEPTPTATATEELAKTAGIDIVNSECPILDDATTEFNWLMEHCISPIGGVSFHLESDFGAEPQTGVSGSGDGYVQFNQLAAGNYSVTRDSTQGEVSTSVYCQSSADGSGPLAEKLFGDDQNQIQRLLVDAELVSCYWFVTSLAEPTPTETPGGVSVETPDVVDDENPTPTATLEPDVAASASISATTYFCPAEFDAGASAEDDLAKNCTVGGPIVEFSLNADGKPIGSQVAGGTPATATFNDVPLDNLVLTQVLSEGLAAPIVFCEITGSDGTILSEYKSEPLVNTSSVGGSLVDGALLRCDFFNVVANGVDPEASPGSTERLAPEDNDDLPGDPNLESASVTITAYECLAPSWQLPDEVAQFDVPDVSITDPGDILPGELPDQVLQDPSSTEFAGCTPTHDGVRFQIARRNNQIYQQTVVSSGNPAIAAFPNAYADGVYIMGVVPQNFSINPIVVCGSSVNGPLRFEGTTSQYGIVIYDLVVDEVMNCNWYNFQIAAPGTVIIKQRLCDQSDGLVASDLATLRAQCDDVTNEAELTVSLQGGAPGTPQNVAAWADGVVTWQDLTPGTYIASQNFVGNFAYPAVHCRSSTAGMPGQIGLRLQPVLGAERNFVSLNVQADSTVYCEWFIAKNGFVRLQDGPVDLTVNAIFCPPGLDLANSDIYDLSFACHDPAQVVTVNLTQQGGGTASRVTPGVYPNWAEFNGMAELTVTIEMQLLPTYGSIRAFCDHLDGIPGNSSIDPEPLMGANMNQFQFLLSEAVFAWDDCTVYYFPAENDSGSDPAVPEADPAALTSDLVINLHLCPQEFDAFKASRDGLAAGCVDQMPGVAFVVGPGQGKEVQATTSGDFASFAEFPDIASGPATVNVTGGADGHVFRVFCSSDSAVLAKVAETGEAEVSGTGIVLDLQPGQNVICDWYAIPPDPILGLPQFGMIERGPARDLSLHTM